MSFTVADIEELRVHLKISRWLVLGGSWGSALALAYAEQFPTSVTELVLFGITTGSREEFDWLFRDGLSAFFPEAWERRLEAVPESDRAADIVEVYSRMLADPDPTVRERATCAWCGWESATAQWPPTTELAPRFRDLAYATAYARLVTHYARHDGWLGDGRVLRQVTRLAAIPGIRLNGRFDFQAPIGAAWRLHRAWPASELVMIDNEGHKPGVEMTDELIKATNHFAGSEPGD